MTPIRSFVLSLFVTTCALACSVAADDASGSPQDPYASVATSGAAIEVRTAPAHPPVRGKVQLSVRIRDAAGAPRDGLDVSVVAFMPSHGHGSAGTPVVTPEGDGMYRVDGCALTMAGVWQLRMTMISPDGTEDHATTTIDVQ